MKAGRTERRKKMKEVEEELALGGNKREIGCKGEKEDVGGGVA